MVALVRGPCRACVGSLHCAQLLAARTAARPLHARMTTLFFCCIKEHLDVAKTLNNLAIINKAMGDNHQALKNYQRVALPRGF
jgi:hypothetical protein